MTHTISFRKARDWRVDINRKALRQMLIVDLEAWPTYGDPTEVNARWLVFQRLRPDQNRWLYSANWLL